MVSSGGLRRQVFWKIITVMMIDDGSALETPCCDD
jgi:hypothetical protein